MIESDVPNHNSAPEIPRKHGQGDELLNDPKRNRILNEVVEKYNESWLGAHNKWGNFEDDLPITQAAKWGSNFIFRIIINFSLSANPI